MRKNDFAGTGVFRIPSKDGSCRFYPQDMSVVNEYIRVIQDLKALQSVDEVDQNSITQLVQNDLDQLHALHGSLMRQLKQLVKEDQNNE